MAHYARSRAQSRQVLQAIYGVVTTFYSIVHMLNSTLNTGMYSNCILCRVCIIQHEVIELFVLKYELTAKLNLTLSSGSRNSYDDMRTEASLGL